MIVGDGPAREQLQKKVSDMNMSEKIIFTGMVPPAEVHKYYQSADIFVSASTSETQGLTYIEAAANSLPLLCRYDECLNNVIVQGENGFAYKDENEFLRALDALLSSTDDLIAMGKRSEAVAEQFDKKIFAERVMRVYTSAIENKKRK